MKNLSIPLNIARRFVLGAPNRYSGSVSGMIRCWNNYLIGVILSMVKYQDFGHFGNVIWTMTNLITSIDRICQVVIETICVSNYCLNYLNRLPISPKLKIVSIVVRFLLKLSNSDFYYPSMEFLKSNRVMKYHQIVTHPNYIYAG